MTMIVVKIVQEERSLYYPSGFHYESLLHNLGWRIQQYEILIPLAQKNAERCTDFYKWSTTPVSFSNIFPVVDAGTNCSKKTITRF